MVPGQPTYPQKFKQRLGKSMRELGGTLVVIPRELIAAAKPDIPDA
jgi:hypothetical protein